MRASDEVASLAERIEAAFDGPPAAVSVVGKGELASWFATSELAVQSIAAAARELLRHAGTSGGARVDRRLAAWWFRASARPVGWTLPPGWDALAGDCRARAEPARLPERDGASLRGLRVLDLTRVLAGPACTRFLAAFGADVPRIDPPHWNESANLVEMTLGKRCAALDLRVPDDRATFARLLRGAHVLVHGYRPGALDALGFGDGERRALNPALVDVSLSAYGTDGPWGGRRGFDSLVQMSSGIAAAGMRRGGADRPVPLPLQALDHATGYLMAAEVLRAVRELRGSGVATTARLSLAKVADLLSDFPTDPVTDPVTDASGPPGDPDYPAVHESSGLGAVRRLPFPVRTDALEVRWSLPAGELRSHAAAWAEPAD